MTIHDKRLSAARPDLADERLRGEVEAERFVAGRPAWVAANVLDIRRQPSQDGALDTQALRGAEVRVFEEAGGWAWLQAEADGYVGYADARGLLFAEPRHTHVVRAPRSFLYPGPDLRFPRKGELSIGSLVEVVGHAETRGTRYALLGDGSAVIEAHLRSVGEPAPDFVAVAESLLNTPYLWGGASGFGIDCSGLVQLSLRMAGKNVLRDADQQERSVGEPVERMNLQRGDLVFWKGHVAIMADAGNMIHANGHTMLVNYEPLDAAIARIGYLYGEPTSYRRP